MRSLGQARRETRARKRSLAAHLFRTSDPLVRAIVVEDSAALIGLVIAAAGLLLRQILGTHTPDAIASLLIGILLAVTAFGLARPLADFLVGRSLAGDQLEKLHAIVNEDPSVEEIQSLRALYSGPEEVIVVAKIHPSLTLSTE